MQDQYKDFDFKNIRREFRPEAVSNVKVHAITVGEDDEDAEMYSGTTGGSQKGK